MSLVCVAVCAVAAVFFTPSAYAGTLTLTSATSVTWGTDNLIAQSSASWKLSFTTATNLVPGDVIQVTFPDNPQGPPFNFQNISLSATSNVWLASNAVAVGGPNGQTIAFTTTSSVSPSVEAGKAVSITVTGITNASGSVQNLANLVWQFKTGTPQDSGQPAGALSATVDTGSAAQSVIRRGTNIVSDATYAFAPSSYAASASNITYTFSFKAATVIPIGGKIALNFPTEYDLSTATTTAQLDINGAGAGNPTVSLYAATVVTGQGRNQMLLTISNSATNANDTLTVAVTAITNPSTANVYRPFYIYTTTAQGGLIDGAYFGFGGENYSGPPPIDTVHIGGNNTLIFTVKKNDGGTVSILDGAERPQVKVGVGCPDKGFFVGERYLTASSSVTFPNLLDCNYMAFTMPSTTGYSAFWDGFLQPSFKEIPASGGGTASTALTFMVPDATITGAITGGVPNYPNGEIMALNETHMAWNPLWNSPAYTTQGLSATGAGYFTLKAKSGSTWQITVPSKFGPGGGGMMQTATSQYWPPVIPGVVVSAAQTYNVGSFAYVLADRALDVVLKNAATNAVITNACVSVKRSGSGFFMAPQNTLCQTNNNNNTSYLFKVPSGSLAIEVMKPGVGKPEEYPVAVNAAAVTSTILISAPTSYIKAVVTENGRAIAGAPIFMQSSSGFGQAMTDALGTATAYVPFGTYRVEGFVPDFGPLTAQTGVVVGSGSNPTVTFTLDSSGYKTVTGRVFINVGGGAGYDEGTDTPLDSIQIGARGTGGTTGGNGTMTSSDGTYTLRLAPGTYTIGGWSKTYGGLSEQNVDVSTANATANFSLAETGTLQITITGGADVSPLFAGAFSPSTGKGNGTDQWTTSGSNKVTTLSLPAGTYEVHVGSPAFGELTPDGGAVGTITAGLTTATTYNVTAGGTLVTLSGTVTDASLNPLENVNVWVSRINGPGSFSTQTNVSGVYTLKVPDTFIYDVGANRSGYLAAHLTITMSGVRTQDFTLVAAGATITGTVANASGTAIANAWVWAEKTATSVWTGAPTDASGAYSLTVDDGTWTIYADGPCYFRSTGLAATAGDTGKNIALAANSSCTAPVPSVQSMTPANGGIINNGTKATVNIPANALGTGSTGVSVSISDADVVPSSPNMSLMSGTVQTITALDASGQSISTLNSNAEIKLVYANGDLPAGFDENNLRAAYWDSTNKKWEPVAATIDPDQNTVTIQMNHFTDVGLGAGDIPPAPQNAASDWKSASRIDLTWNTISNATTYTVYRATSSGGTFTSVGTSSSASYSDTGLSAATWYYYKITAANANGESTYSAETSSRTDTNPAVSSSGGGGTILPVQPSSAVSPAVTSTSTPTSAVVPISSPTGARIEGTLIRYADSPKVYVLEIGKKRWIQTAEDFVKLGFDWAKIVIVPASETYAEGEVKKMTRGQITQLFVRNLARGARGPEVKALQEKLKELGFFPAHIATIEYFGPATQKAVMAFQKARGLSQVGSTGPRTRALLNQE